MSAGNPTFTDNFLITSISPQTVNNTSVASGWVYAGDALNLVALALVGATDAAVTVTVEQAKDSSGTSAKAVTDAEATWTATDDNKDGVVQVETTKLDKANGFAYARLKIAVANGSTGGVVAGALLNESRHKPVVQGAKLLNDVLIAG